MLMNAWFAFPHICRSKITLKGNRSIISAGALFLRYAPPSSSNTKGWNPHFSFASMVILFALCVVDHRFIMNK